MKKLSHKYINSQLKEREAFSNKGDYGHALIIAGHEGRMGAAVISAMAGLRTGVGLLTVNVPKDERMILQCAIPEAMLIMRTDKKINLDKFTSVGIGPGLGIDKTAEDMLVALLAQVKSPMVIDADALNIISNHKKLLNNLPANTILTPHIVEFDRLFGVHENQEDRINTAIEKAKEFNIIIVLKNHHTAIVSPLKTYYNTTGNAGLAKGGSGDALTGSITSFLAQGYAPVVAANLGVYINGLAADITLKKQSMESMHITDVIGQYGNAFKEIRS